MSEMRMQRYRGEQHQGGVRRGLMVLSNGKAVAEAKHFALSAGIMGDSDQLESQLFPVVFRWDSVGNRGKAERAAIAIEFNANFAQIRPTKSEAPCCWPERNERFARTLKSILKWDVPSEPAIVDQRQDSEAKTVAVEIFPGFSPEEVRSSIRPKFRPNEQRNRRQQNCPRGSQPKTRIWNILDSPRCPAEHRCSEAQKNDQGQHRFNASVHKATGTNLTGEPKKVQILSVPTCSGHPGFLITDSDKTSPA
jgi:hypothetical protein